MNTKTTTLTLIIVLALGAVVLYAFGASFFNGTEYDTYGDTKYGYEIDYPVSFVSSGAVQNSNISETNGQVFEGDHATLRVFVTENFDNQALRLLAESYMSLNGELPEVKENRAQESVSLRAEVDDDVQWVKVIQLHEQTVGVAVLEYDDDTLREEVAEEILQSFHRVVGSGNNTENEDSSASNAGDGSGAIPMGYRVYENADLDLRMLVPGDASVRSEGAGRIKVQLLGPLNQPDTEVTDGFTMTLARNDSAASYASAREYAESVIERTRSGSDNQIVTELEERDVNGMEAYRYSYRGVLESVVTEYVFLPQAETGYRASYSIQDPENRGYEDVVFTILESLELGSGTRGGGVPVHTSVQIALLDFPASGEAYTKESDGPQRGCDRVVLEERSIEPTTAPLTVALEELFSLDEENYNGWQHFIAQTNDTLSFDRATVENGVASIYLEGELTGLSGACDNPRAQIQIEETALQFDTVREVVFFLNGEQTDLIPDERGE